MLLVAVLCSAFFHPSAGVSAERARKMRTSRPGPSAAAARYRAEASRELSEARRARDRVLAARGARTIANTLSPYNDLLIQLDALLNGAQLMEEVHPDSLVRVNAQRMEQAGSKLASEVSTDPRMYHAIQAVDVSRQDAPTRYFVFKTLRDFRRSGVDKDDSTRARIRKLDERMVETSQRFDINISEDKSTIQVDPKDLEGLPEDYVKGHPQGADGKVLLTSAYPDFYPFLTYSKSEAARKRYLEIFLNRAYPANDKVLDTLLALRQEYATILGYPSWAAYITEDKM